MRSILSALLAGTLILIGFSSLRAQSLRNAITLDNQSGEPALVKVVGPTAHVIEVSIGQKRTVNVAAGNYYYSVIMITLHKVVGGNYPTRPTSREEFEKVGVSLQKEAGRPPGEVSGILVA